MSAAECSVMLICKPPTLVRRARQPAQAIDALDLCLDERFWEIMLIAPVRVNVSCLATADPFRGPATRR